MNRNRYLLLVLIGALLVRLISLDQSLWLDEGVTAKVVTTITFSSIISTFSVTDFHPPLYYLFMKVWTGVFGASVISLRMPSILFTLLTGYFLYKIGKHLKNESTGMWAAAFFLFNPLIVYYSQEARMYMMATFFLTAAFFNFILVCHPERDSGSRINFGMKSIILFNVFIFLAFLTFYGSAFFVAALYGYLIFKREWKTLAYLLPGFIFAILIVLPLLQIQYQNSKEVLGLVVNWRSVLGQANIKNLILIPLKFAFGRISFEPKFVYYALSSLWALFVFTLVVNGARKYVRLGYFFVMPIVMGILFSFLSPLLQYFRFLYLIPIMSLLLALGSRYSDKRLRIGARSVLLLGFVVLSLVYLMTPQFHREDWKRLAQEIPNNIVYLIPSVSDAIVYYRPTVRIKDIRNPPKKDAEEFVLIPYVADLYGYDYKKIYEENGFTLQESHTVRGIAYEIWR